MEEKLVYDKKQKKYYGPPLSNELNLFEHTIFKEGLVSLTATNPTEAQEVVQQS